jgi:Mg2+ and Co2+ transporter CorA
VDVLAGMLAAIFAAAAFVAGVFGMNFKTPLFDEEEDKFGLTEGTLFNIVIFSLLFLLLAACTGTYFFFSTTKCCSFDFLRRGSKAGRTDYFEERL